jgi:release factor glutamine methyltransferase
VQVCAGSLLEPVAASGLEIDVVIANLPWVAPPIVQVTELVHDAPWRGPRDTVAGGGRDGLDLQRRLLQQASALLHPHGWLVLGLAEWQVPILREECAAEYVVGREVPYFLILQPRSGAESTPVP